MKIGMIGLGKLGLPVALTIESRGHKVRGYDINPNVAQYLIDRDVPFKEEGLQPLLDNTNLKLVEPRELIGWADIIFVAIQTPHQPLYEGTARLPNSRRDFDYTYLIDGIKQLASLAKQLRTKTNIAVISTCLPGTFDKYIKPLLNEFTEYVYTPQFIAMGTVVDDYLNPEFNLIGDYSGRLSDRMEVFYAAINSAPPLKTDITTAEAIKVSYNTFITTKTVLGNLWGEIAHKTGANVDDIYKAWSLSTDRLISPKYLRAGMGDGGGCHPRDNIALSWLADKIDLSYNYFDALMMARERHTEWLADSINKIHCKSDLPVILLGKSFKPETDIRTGSPAILLANLLREKNVAFDHVGEYEDMPAIPAIYFIATKHQDYQYHKFANGSIVIDPFGYIPSQAGVEIIRLGRS